MINTLIDKSDTFDVVRDKIAQILANETENQKALAVDAGKNPKLWDLKVFTERSSNWDDCKPGEIIVNVWFESDSMDERSSDTINRQAMRGIFNIDVIGFGHSKSGVSGDELAVREATRGMMLVRNIIMSDIYTYLDMRGVVGGRKPINRSFFQPASNNKTATHAMGARLALEVSYNEFSPEQTPSGFLKFLSVKITKAETGQVLAQLDFDYDA